MNSIRCTLRATIAVYLFESQLKKVEVERKKRTPIDLLLGHQLWGHPNRPIRAAAVGVDKLFIACPRRFFVLRRGRRRNACRWPWREPIAAFPTRTGPTHAHARLSTCSPILFLQPPCLRRAHASVCRQGELAATGEPAGGESIDRGWGKSLLTVYFGTPNMFITLWFGFDYETNPPLGTLII
jgi:hypothetical protein